MSVPILALEGVSKRFVKDIDFAAWISNRFGANIQREVVHALDGVNLSIRAGEVVGLVGESGCGKSTLGRIAAGVVSPTEGKVSWRGHDRENFDGRDRKKSNLAVQMIFQDPFSSLNPRLRIRDIIGEAPLTHGIVTRAERDDYLASLLRKVGLDPAYLQRYPHQFSGGQRQRIGIARALAVKPEFIVCDEAVSALDVSIQSQILNLFMDLREEFELTYLFISHDLSTVEYLSSRVVIMYLGRVVESAPTEELFANPVHPYTRALLNEIPQLTKRRQTYVPIKGEIPSPLDPPKGCHFHPRCPLAFARCREERPVLRKVGPERHSACHLD